MQGTKQLEFSGKQQDEVGKFQSAGRCKRALTWMRVHLNGTSTMRWIKATRTEDGRILSILAKDNDDGVRGNVAENHCTPPDVLSTLSKDESPYVRASVAKNPNTPIDTVIALSEDPDPRVSKAAIGHPYLPVGKVIELIEAHPIQAEHPNMIVPGSFNNTNCVWNEDAHVPDTSQPAKYQYSADFGELVRSLMKHDRKKRAAIVEELRGSNKELADELKHFELL